MKKISSSTNAIFATGGSLEWTGGVILAMLRAILPEIHPQQIDKSEAKKLMKIGAAFTNISESDRQLHKLVVSFAQTTLPVNFFRNAKSKSFTNELRSIKAVPSYDTIQRHMTKLAAEGESGTKCTLLRNSARPLDKPTRQNRIGCGGILDHFEMDLNSASHRF